MATSLDSIKVNGAKLETPFLVCQVESHLIFGPLSRHVPLAYLALGLGILGLIAGFYATGEPVGQYVGDTLDKLIFLAVPLLLLRMTYRQQAIVAWIAVKVGMGIAAVMLATIGAGVSFLRGQADA